MRAYFLQLVFVLEKFKNRWISNWDIKNIFISWNFY
jgi:hypothetical protein